MSLRDLRVLGDPVLRSRSDEVTDFDSSLRHLVRDMVDTMHEEGGIGLAAPQVGVPLRVFTFAVPLDAVVDGQRAVAAGHLINPVLLPVDDEEVLGIEGCLSIPGVLAPVRRRRRVIARGFSAHGDPVEVSGSDLLARCFQHEVDHLDGVLFLDRLDPDERARLLTELAEMGEQPVVKDSPHS